MTYRVPFIFQLAQHSGMEKGVTKQGAMKKD